MTESYVNLAVQREREREMEAQRRKAGNAHKVAISSLWHFLISFLRHRKNVPPRRTRTLMDRVPFRFLHS